MFDKVIIKPLRMGGDERGVQAAPSLDLLQMSDGPIQDLHIATIRPGFVRGNHVSEMSSERNGLFDKGWIVSSKPPRRVYCLGEFRLESSLGE